MLNRNRMPEFITYQIVLDAIGRDGMVEEAVDLLRTLKERDLIDGRNYNKLLNGLQDEYGGHNKISRCSVRFYGWLFAAFWILISLQCIKISVGDARSNHPSYATGKDGRHFRV